MFYIKKVWKKLQSCNHNGAAIHEFNKLVSYLF